MPVPVDQEELRNAMERVSRCLTGKLVADGGTPVVYVPEVNERCLQAKEK